MTAASTSMAQSSSAMHQHEFLFNTPEVSTPSYNEGQSYEEEVEGEVEVHYSQPWSTPRAMPQMTLPPVANSHRLPEGATNQARQFMARYDPSSPQIPLMH